MFGKISEKLNIIYTTALLTSTVFFSVENTTMSANAQSPDYLYSSCVTAYQSYQHYNAQPVASPMDSEFATSAHNMRMTNQALNTVTNCAIRYANLVSQDSTYCNHAVNYMEQISPIMLTAATTVNFNCLR